MPETEEYDPTEDEPQYEIYDNYKNVNFSVQNNRYVGCKQSGDIRINCSAQSARLCALKLNAKCIEKSIPPPNPGLLANTTTPYNNQGFSQNSEILEPASEFSHTSGDDTWIVQKGGKRKRKTSDSTNPGEKRKKVPQPDHKTLLDQRCESGSGLEAEGSSRISKRKRSEHNEDAPIRKKAALKTSEYVGVTWRKKYKKWIATIYVMKNGKKCAKSGGSYFSEIDAAHGVNALCDELKIDRKNPSLGDPPSTWKRTPQKQKVVNGTRECFGGSEYTGVLWKPGKKKWRAVINVGVGRKKIYGGFYESELDAAYAVNSLCDEHNIDRKNPLIADAPDDFERHPDTIYGEKQTKFTSKYIGVNFSMKCKKWQAAITINKKWINGGLYNSELDAAYAVNSLCDEHNIDRKNSELGDSPTDWCRKKTRERKGNGASKYVGVYLSWKKWTTAIVVNGKRLHGGTYTSEVDAAHAVNALCDENKIDRKNPQIGDPPATWVRAKTETRQKALKSSEYVGVYWAKKFKKWRAVIYVLEDGKRCRKSNGTYISEIDAAHAVNALCDDLKIDRKNPSIGDPPSTWKCTKEIKAALKTSEYVGVRWRKKYKKWTAKIYVMKDGKQCAKSGGCYSSEIDAAHAVNALCDSLHIDRKNPIIGDPPSTWKSKIRKSSQYVGVAWARRSRKFRACIIANKRPQSGGSYITELEAAHAVNSLCDEFGLKRKNPEIGDPPSGWKRHETRKVVKTSQYIGVIRHRDTKWSARVQYKTQTGKRINLKSECYNSEVDAAYAVNELCDRHGIQRKNPKIGEPPATWKFLYKEKRLPDPSVGEQWECLYSNGEKYLCKIVSVNANGTYDIKWNDGSKDCQFGHPRSHFALAKNFASTSKYWGVHWNSRKQMWSAGISIRRNKIDGGWYRTELEAAHAVNALCDKHGVCRRNHNIEEASTSNNPAVGEKWKCLYVDQQKDDCEIVSVNENGTYDVEWIDGDEEHRFGHPRAHFSKWTEPALSENLPSEGSEDEEEQSHEYDENPICEHCDGVNSSSVLHPSRTVPGLQICFLCFVEECETDRLPGEVKEEI